MATRTESLKRIGLSLLGFCLLSVCPLLGAEWGQEKNRFSVNSRIGFNISADFKGLGGLVPTPDVGPNQGGANHAYNDGFVKVDSSNDSDGQTWYWGYESDSQIDAANDQLVLSALDLPSTGRSEDASDDPQYGVEVVYTRQLGWNSSYWWGLDFGLGWVNLDIEDRVRSQAVLTRVTDRYALGGVIPPAAPYAGSFAGPGPLISDTPDRYEETLDLGATTEGRYRINADIYTARLGLLFETPFTERLVLQFGGGGIVGLARSEFQYNESVQWADDGSRTQTGSTTDDEFVGGAYALAGLTYYATDWLMFNAGAQYNYMSGYEQTVDEREAKVSFKNSIYVAAGVTVAF